VLLLLAVFAFAGCARGEQMTVYGWIVIDNEEDRADFIVHGSNWYMFDIEPQREYFTYALRLPIRNADDVLSMLNTSLGEREAVRAGGASVVLRRVWPFRRAVQIDEILHLDMDRFELVEFVMTDYIYMHNMASYKQHRQMHVGDDFMGLVLDEVVISDIIYTNGEFTFFSELEAHLSGEITVFGRLSIPTRLSSILTFAIDVSYACCFPHTPQRHLTTSHLRWYAHLRFVVDNEDFIMEALGLCPEETRTRWEHYSVEAYVTITNLTLHRVGRSNRIIISDVNIKEVE